MKLSQNLWYIFPLCTFDFRFWAKSKWRLKGACYQIGGWGFQVSEHCPQFVSFSSFFWRLDHIIINLVLFVKNIDKALEKELVLLHFHKQIFDGKFVFSRAFCMINHTFSFQIDLTFVSNITTPKSWLLYTYFWI